MNSSPPSATESLARSLGRGLRLELFLTPKPGLVDLLDSGSHPDLSVPRMLASIDLVEEYIAELAAVLARQAPLAELVALGRRAEGRMLARLGTNTHKGAIFLGGLLLVARHRTPGGRAADLPPAVAAAAREFFTLFPPSATHGAAARRDHRLSGIVGEAAAGLPSLFIAALPAYRETLERTGDHHLAPFAMLARLMQTVEDTTAVHRCGPAGLARLRRDGERLEKAIGAGDDPYPILLSMNAEYRQMNLTMGGVADLLGLGFGILDQEGMAGELTPAVQEGGVAADLRRWG